MTRPRIHHVGLGVVDVDRAERYWHDVVGARRVADWRPGPSTGTGSRLLAADNVHLELLPVADQPAAPPPTDPGIGHVCVQSWLDVDAVARLEAAGTTFPREPAMMPTTITYAYADDPEGNVVELEQWQEARAEPPVWPAHVGFATTSIQPLHDFWTAVFDQEPVAAMRLTGVPGMDQIIGNDDTDLHWRMFDLGPFKLELAQYLSPVPSDVPPATLATRGWNHVALEVDDVDREVDRLSDLGASFDEVDAHDGGGRSVHGRDPDGNVLELLDPVAAGSPWQDLRQILP